MKLGLFIGRLNPPHNGHLKIIEKSLKENNKTLILLGSSNLIDKNNPFDFQTRKNLLLSYFKIRPNLKILDLEDVPSNLCWAINVYKKIIENYPSIENINFYAGDFENDSAYKVIKRYKKFFFKFHINFIEVPRKGSFVEYNGKKLSLSSTNFRKILNEKNNDFGKKFTKKEIYDKLEKISLPEKNKYGII